MSDTNDFHNRLQQLHADMLTAKALGHIGEYNNLAAMYNALVEEMSIPVEDSLSLTENDAMIELPFSSNESLNRRHAGICNTLRGIVSNTAKGKYTDADKQFFIAFLKECIGQLDEINAHEAYMQRQKRKNQFSKISERI